MGIEPTYQAWKASVLPLNYARARQYTLLYQKTAKGESLLPGQAPLAEPLKTAPVWEPFNYYSKKPV